MKVRISMSLLILILLAGMACVSAGGEDACPHHWELVKTEAPTCTGKGKEWYRCSLCGKKKSKTIPALGHEWGMCTMLVQPTCTEDGLVRCFCTRDSSHYEDKIQPAWGHSWGDWFVLKQPTLTSPGVRERRCSRCGEVQQEKIPAQIQREEYALTLIAVPAGVSETGCSLLCALVNTGRTELLVREYCFGEEKDLFLTEETITLPAGQAVSFRLTERMAEAADLCPELRFYGESGTGERVCASNPVFLPVHEAGEEETALSAALRICQTVQSRPAGENGYGIGETVQWTVTVSNTGEKCISGIYVTGALPEEAWVIEALNPGETRELACEHQITVEDAIAGYYCRILSASADGGKASGGEALVSDLLIVPAEAR